jgi:hypothetical protein
MDLVGYVYTRGAVRYGDLRAAGFTRGAIDRAIAKGSLLRPYRGVLTTASNPAAQAVAKWLGGVLSHTTAAEDYGLPLVSATEDVHVTVPRDRRPGG